MLVKRKMDEMITHFNDVVSAMDISIKDKMTILGMITAIGYEYQKAADAIEELANKLCDWCGVCPKERRRPWDCEIMWPNAPITEVYIEPPKEET